MDVRSSVASGAAQVTSWGLRRVLHREASQLPGRVGLVIDPQLIAHLAGKLSCGSVVVCGTNGKTTTNNVLAEAVEASGATVLCNRVGANMEAGVAAALVPGHSADWGVFEADELSCIHILPQLRPRMLVLLNLFRDQLDRAGEIDHVQDVLVESLLQSPETRLLVCGDDPLAYGVALRAAAAGTHVSTFGIAQDLQLPADRVAEAAFCQKCGAALAYRYRTYAQLGDYACPDCSFGRPKLDYRAVNVVADREGVSFAVEGPGMDGERAELNAQFGGVYMVYNLMAAFAAARMCGTSAEQYQNVLNDYHPHNGRLQHFFVGGREVVLNLAKNPTGFNQNISLMQADGRAKACHAVINDNPNDGQDVSWLWDVDFERLAHDGDAPVPERVSCGGLRANDLQVRMKYAGVKASLAGSVAEALVQVADLPVEVPLYVLTNYSALWPAKAELEELAGE